MVAEEKAAEEMLAQEVIVQETLVEELLAQMRVAEEMMVAESAHYCKPESWVSSTYSDGMSQGWVSHSRSQSPFG